MRTVELERRLIEFVDRVRPPGGPPVAVGPETALFEDGIIDSLRILDLIAFVEAATASKVPDAAVRLDNFRSVRAIATAFGADGDAAGTTDERHDPLRVFERRAPATSRGRPVDQLSARGELSLELPGRACFRGAALRVLEYFDAVASGWARQCGARAVAAPHRISREVLARAGRPTGGPGLAVEPVPPAVCYHVYGQWEESRLDRSPVLVSLRGRCLRDEEALDLARGRLRDFEMREIVVLGSRGEVERFRQRMIDRLGRLMEELDLEGRLEIAGDPFFLDGVDPAARGRRLMQQVLPLKLELRLPLDDSDRLCAVASLNHHLDFFGRRFQIRLASGASAHSGCVAFGLERWTLAFLARHGTRPKAWPAQVRAFAGGGK